jgi:hypothetical protein
MLGWEGYKIIVVKRAMTEVEMQNGVLALPIETLP